MGAGPVYSGGAKSVYLQRWAEWTPGRVAR